MGALTLKNYPYELRGWDIENFESVDPTDGLGSNTRVYISKNKIVQIEPIYDTHSLKAWITDKSRLFFDSIFIDWIPSSVENKKITKSYDPNAWLKIINTLVKNIYIFDLCNSSQNKEYFLTVAFEDISLEILALLNIMSNSCSFIKIKRIEKNKISNNLEANFQLNSVKRTSQLKQTTLCLLVAANPRFEGFSLNLKLRKRLLEGNFKVLSLSSFVNLTFPITLLGSNIKILKTISEGNHLTCQNIKSAHNPTLIVSSNISKRNDSSHFENLFKVLKFSRFLNSKWYGYNMLNTSLHETGIKAFSYQHLLNTDVNSFSSLYLINMTTNSSATIKKAVKSKLLNFQLNKNNQFLANEKLIIEQNPIISNTEVFIDKKNYYYLPVSMFYENRETFINTEGLIKKPTKLIFRKKNKSNWQIIRRILKVLNSSISFINAQENKILFFKTKELNNFRNFINFHFYASQSLTSMSYYLNMSNKPFYSYSINNNFKIRNFKILSTKLKFWLDDFYTGGKDTYSQHSAILAHSSNIIRVETTNFF